MRRCYRLRLGLQRFRSAVEGQKTCFCDDLCCELLNTSQLCDATASFFGKLPTVEGRRGQSIALSECADIGRIRRRTGDHVYKVRRRSSRGEGQSRLDCLRLGQSGCAGDHWIRPFDDLRRLYSGYD